MSDAISTADRELLAAIRVKADELARMCKDACDRGYQVQFNLNGVIGACDVFNVHRLTPVDMRSSAN